MSPGDGGDVGLLLGAQVVLLQGLGHLGRTLGRAVLGSNGAPRPLGRGGLGPLPGDEGREEAVDLREQGRVAVEVEAGVHTESGH